MDHIAPKTLIAQGHLRARLQWASWWSHCPRDQEAIRPFPNTTRGVWSWAPFIIPSPQETP